MEQEIIRIMQQVFAPCTITAAISQSTCDKWDSLNHLNLVTALEEVFDVDLEPEQIAAMQSYDDVVRIMKGMI